MPSSCELKERPESKPLSAPDSSPDQQELRERYEEQLRRLCCPSCGEEPFTG